MHPEKLELWNMKIQMTEIQKAYLIGREDAFTGGVGTHLYVELLYEGQIEKVEKALNKIIKSQPYLRAKIADGFQFDIQDIYEYRINTVNATFDDETEITKIRKTLSHKKYTKEDFPLYTLQAIGKEGKYRLIFSIDLLIADGLSLYEFITELNDYIENPENIEKETIDYSNDLLYMMEYYKESKQTKQYNRAKKYYLNHIEHIFEAPKLNYRSDHDQDTTFLHKEHSVSCELYETLKGKAKQKGVSVTDILLGVYVMVLAKWSQTPEMSINVTAFKRPDEERYRHVMGDFTTSMLVQAAYDFEKRFEENVRQLKLKLFTALKYQNFEVTEVIKELDKIGKASLMPVVFTSMLFDTDTLFGENLKKDYIISQTSQVYLDFQAKNNGGELNLTWDYRKNKFIPEMIDTMFTEYCDCLEHYIAQEEELGEYYLKYTKERALKQYRDFNSLTAPMILKETTMAEYLRNACKQYWDKTFAVIDGTEYTFSYICQAAEQLAGRINEKKKECGKKNTRIAFSGSKCLNSLVCIVTAMLTGDSFCALNEYFGGEKKQEVLDVIENYIYVENQNIIEVSESNEEINSGESYILFTSGTTGKPKGIIISEEAARNTVQAINEMHSVTSEDVIMNISNLYFDLSIYDIFGAIMTGATVCMVDVYQMEWFLQSDYLKKVTFWNSTPSLAREILLNYDFVSVRSVLMSGDFVQKKLVSELYAKYDGKLKVYALGGATEASIWSNYFDCIEHQEKVLIPYGLPLANQQMYVQKENGLLTDVGVLGEIIIGGDGLADGYLSKKQTEEAFVWNDCLNERIYKTGDLGYLGADNNIYIVGRVANEIKHNGYRVDLREIEKYINAVVQVKDSFVFIDKLESGRTRLICTVVSENKEIEKVIRKELSQKVPQYMIPTNFLLMETIPLTQNGKVNMRQIVQLLADKGEDCEFTEKEKEVIQIFNEIIKAENYIEPERKHDTFFDLGGQSLQLVVLKDYLDKKYGINISLQDLMGNLSIEGLSGLLEEAGTVEQTQSKQLILLRQGKSKDKKIVFIHAGSGEVNVYINLCRYLDETYSVYGVRYELEGNAFGMYDYNFKKMAKKYCQILKDIDSIDYIGGWCIGGRVGFEMALLEPEKYKKLIMFNSTAPVRESRVFIDSSFESDFALVKDLLDDSVLQSCKNNTETLWRLVAKAVDEQAEVRQAVISMLPENLVRLMPNLDNLTGEQLVTYINVFRSSADARFSQESNEYVDSECYYFRSLEETEAGYEAWASYVGMFHDIPVIGDHVTMFQGDNAKSLAEKVNACLSV